MASQLKVSDVELMTIGYRNRTILVFSICFPLAVLSVSLRFLSRVLAKNPFWWDDWFALIGLVSSPRVVSVEIRRLIRLFSPLPSVHGRRFLHLSPNMPPEP